MRRLPTRRIRLRTDHSDKRLFPLLSATVEARPAEHCVEQGWVPVPRGVLTVVRDTHWMLLAAWYRKIALLAPTRSRTYWSSP